MDFFAIIGCLTSHGMVISPLTFFLHNREEDKRRVINVQKDNKSRDLEERTAAVLRARQARSSAAQQQKAIKQQKEEAARQRAEYENSVAAEHLFGEISTKREARDREMRRLKEEEERIAKQQMYLGAAAHQVSVTFFYLFIVYC